MKTQDDPHGSAFEERLRRHYQSVYGPAPNPELIWSQIAQRLDDQVALGTSDVNRRGDSRALDSELHAGGRTNTRGSAYPAQGAGSHLRAFVAVAATLLVIATSSAVFGLLATEHKSPIGPTAPTSTETPSTTLPPDFGLMQMQMLSDWNGWAAGILDSNTPNESGLLLHFDGFRWSTAYTLPHSAFNSVSMISPTEGWVTGITIAPNKEGGSITGSFILHYQHGRWVHETAPMAAMISLKMFTATSGWALGTTIKGGTWGTPYRQVAVYQNGTWTVSDEPCYFCQVTFLPDGVGWAWGPSKDANNTSGFWHYRNGKWIAISFPGLDPYGTFDMAFNSQIDGWALEWVPLSSDSNSMLLHFNGLDWEQVHVPATVWPENAGVGTAIFLISPTEFFIVNIKYTDATDTLPEHITLIHYDNGAWSTLALPKNYLFSSPGNPRPTSITDISVISPNDLWVAGTDWITGDLHGSVIGHFHNGTWTMYQ